MEYVFHIKIFVNYRGTCGRLLSNPKLSVLAKTKSLFITGAPSVLSGKTGMHLTVASHHFHLVAILHQRYYLQSLHHTTQRDTDPLSNCKSLFRVKARGGKRPTEHWELKPVSCPGDFCLKIFQFGSLVSTNPVSILYTTC